MNLNLSANAKGVYSFWACILFPSYLIVVVILLGLLHRLGMVLQVSK